MKNEDITWEAINPLNSKIDGCILYSETDDEFEPVIFIQPRSAMRITIEGATVEQARANAPVEFHPLGWLILEALNNIEMSYPEHKMHFRLSMENAGYRNGYELSVEVTLSQSVPEASNQEG